MTRCGASRMLQGLGVCLSLLAVRAPAQPVPVDGLYLLTPGSTKAVNALWGENPLSLQFVSSRTVTVADLPGPGIITMIHFAYPQHWSARQSLNRDLLLRIYWDGASTPSVECPLVDFFCDPNGEQDPVNTAFVNVRKGYNAYFPMPFRTSARIVLAYDGTLPAGSELKADMPCYSYVCYRSLGSFPPNAGYFCASWRQQQILLGTDDYVVLDATGPGKCIGWNVTVRSPYPNQNQYPVDENVKFVVDGAASAALNSNGWTIPSALAGVFRPEEISSP
jgi:hypothetical protein